jgi:hypothetical protein
MVDIGQMPTSCADLQRMGQKISGFFLVKGAKKMEALYCNFYPNQNGTRNFYLYGISYGHVHWLLIALFFYFSDKQKWIGYADVKSAPVHFYVQRNSSFDTTNTPISFSSARVNEGNAISLPTGKFTSPRTGTYFFFFTGVATFPVSAGHVQLGLYLNGGQIGKGVIEKSNVLLRQWSLLSLQSTLYLTSGDRVWVQIDSLASGVILYGNSDHLTHFTGFMLEEEIVTSF